MLSCACSRSAYIIPTVERSGTSACCQETVQPSRTAGGSSTRLGVRCFAALGSGQRRVTCWSFACMSSVKCHRSTGSTAPRCNHGNKQTFNINYIWSCHDDHLFFLNSFSRSFIASFLDPQLSSTPPSLLLSTIHLIFTAITFPLILPTIITPRWRLVARGSF